MKLNKDNDVLICNEFTEMVGNLSLGKHIGWHDISNLDLRRVAPAVDYLSVYMIYEAEEIVKEYNRPQREENSWFNFPEDLYVTFASAWEQDDDS